MITIKELVRREFIKTHNFILTVVDTDSIAFVKPDMSFFSEDEQQTLLDEINSYMPEKIRYADDGYFDMVLVLKAKNYVLKSGDKLKIKGSALVDQKREPAIRSMIKEIIDSLLEITPDSLESIYNKYVQEALNPYDIGRWAQKKTITKSVLAANNIEARKNERDVYEAVKNKSIQEGDKVYVYSSILSKKIESKILKNGKLKENLILTTGLSCVEDYKNDHNIEHLLKRVYNTICLFENVIDISRFTNFTLSKNNHLLKELTKTDKS